MFYIAICDDEKEICHQIETILLQHARSHALQLSIEVFYDGDRLYHFINREHPFDLIYLDIEMPSLNGLDLSLRIRNEQDDHSTSIVFISGSDRYDRQLFDVQPLHFLPKPLNPASILSVLELARKLNGDTEKAYTFQIGKDTFRIPYRKILYFESRNRQITVHTEENSFTFYGQIRRLAAETPPCFCRIHKSFIVNLHQVSSFHSSSVTMSNGKVLSVGETYRTDFREKQLMELTGEIEL